MIHTDTTIYILDDNMQIRKALSKMVQSIPNASVMHLDSDYSDAISYLTVNKPDIAIIDINLPSGDGFEVARMLKQAGTQTIVIILTNYSANQFRQKAFSIGADYFFDKTADFDKVFDTIEYLATKVKTHSA